MATNPLINRQTVDTVFGNLPRPQTLIVLATVWQDDDAAWVVTAESGYLITDLAADPALGGRFADQAAADRHAEAVSREWRRLGERDWRKGARHPAYRPEGGSR